MTKKSDAAPTEVQTPTEVKESRVTIGFVVTELVMDATLSYDAIVHLIYAQFKDAQTSRQSVASVAARLRKDGIEVPMRRQQNGDAACRPFLLMNRVGVNETVAEKAIRRGVALRAFLRRLRKAGMTTVCQVEAKTTCRVDPRRNRPRPDLSPA